MNYQQQKKISLIIGIILILLSIVLGILIYKAPENANAHLFQVGVTILAAAFTAFLSMTHAGMVAKAEIEKRDLEDRPPEENIFDESEEGFIGPQQKALESFRKIIIPIFLIAISAIEYIGATYMFTAIVPENFKLPEQGSNPFLLNSFILFGLTFIFFASGKYLSGLAYGENATLLKPNSGRLLFSAFAAIFAGACSLLASYGHFQWIDICNKLLGVITITLATERLLLWVLDMYRPREVDEIEAPVYESRLLSIFSRPSGFIGNLSDVLEYQFGFRISEQIIKSFLFKILIPFGVVQSILLLIFSTVTYVPPNYTAILSSAGENKTLEPGLNFTLPYPLAKIQRIETSKIKKLNFTMGEDTRTDQEKADKPFLESQSWQNEDFNKSVYLSGSKHSNQALIVLNAELLYKVNSQEALSWGTFENPELFLKNLAKRALTATLLNQQYEKLHSLPIPKLEELILDEIKVLLENHQLGVELKEVQITNFQPHPAIADAWFEVLSAKEESKKIIAEAQTYASVSKYNTQVEKSDIENKSNADYLMNKALTEADRDIFKTRLNAYKKYHELYTQFEFIEVLSKHLSKVRKVVFTSEQQSIAELDLKKPQPNILDITE